MLCLHAVVVGPADVPLALASPHVVRGPLHVVPGRLYALLPARLAGRVYAAWPLDLHKLQTL